MEEHIIKYKSAGEHSLFFFGREVVGNEFIVPHVHGELAKWLCSPERERVKVIGGVETKSKLVMVLLPRDSLKTTFLSAIYPLWRIVNNPDIRILIDSESRDLSKMILKNIKDTIDNCKPLRAIWGDFNGQANGLTWNLEGIRVNGRTDYKAKEDTVETSGIDVAVTGRHYPLIILEDLHSERNTKSREQIQKVKDHIQLMMPLLENGGEMIVVGTRWSDDDSYDWITTIKDDNNQPLFDTFIHSAYNDDGSAYYPERNNLASLALKKKTMSESLFSCQFL